MFAAKVIKPHAEAGPGRRTQRPPASAPSSVAHTTKAMHAWNLGTISLSHPSGARPTQSQTQERLPVAPANGAQEREADSIADRAVDQGESHPLLDQGLAHARVHHGAQPERSAARLGAAAFTLGDTITFGPGRYRPDTPSGRRLIAHEAVHVGQQLRSGQRMVQRKPDDSVQMPPMQVSPTLKPVEGGVGHLDTLTNQGVTPSTIGVEHAAADIERNSPDPAAVLPFTPAGWDGDTILKKLGQYDRMPGTDSDALRCVQAVGMAARIPDGPAAVSAYLGALVAQGLLTGEMTPRKRTAIEVLKYVAARIASKRATFGDLSWAQEAMHDLFYNDVSGTPLTDVTKQVAPSLDLSKSLQPMDVWCDTPQDLLAQANRLKPGEQLLVEEFSVSLNTTFDQLSEQHIEVAEGQSTTVLINGRPVRIKRIPLDRRPPHTALDFHRDTRAGHQILVMKDAANGALRLYDPEISDSGEHLGGMAADGSDLVTRFHDQPAFGIYRYMEIIGKLQPGLTAPNALTTPPARQ